MPDTTSSTRYVDFDAPYLKQSFTDAGYTSSQFQIDNAQGSDATELSDATADINLGAKVLIVDELDNPTGIAVAKLAEQKGVTLIAYDRAIFQGTSTYYVSFNNELVGELIGQGFEACVKAWGIAKPKVYVLNGGEDTDSNSIAFASGYNKVVWGQGPRRSPPARPTASATRWSPRTSPPAGTTPRAAPSSSRPTPPTRDQRHDRGQRRARQRGDHRPQVGRRQGRQGADRRSGRHRAGHGLDPPELPVRLRLQGHLQRGSGRRGHGHDPAGRPAAARGPAERHDRRPGRLEHHRAGVPADPGVGDQGQHGVDRRQGRLRHAKAICALAGASACSAAGIK